MQDVQSKTTLCQTEEPNGACSGEREQPTAVAIVQMIAEASEIVQAAEQRRQARRELRTLIETIEHEAELATTEEDYPAADWLKSEAKRLRKSAFGAISPVGKPAPISIVPKAPDTPRPVEPAIVPAQAVPVVVVLPPEAKGDLAHWFARWAEVKAQFSATGSDTSDRQHALDVRAVLCGIHAYVIRLSDDPSYAKSVKAARDLRKEVAAYLQSLAWPWEAPSLNKKGLDSKERAAEIRRLSDCYCRAALACRLFENEQASPSLEIEMTLRRLTAAAATMQYLKARLTSLKVEDPLVAAIAQDIAEKIAPLGIATWDGSPWDDETPPYISKDLTNLLGLGQPEPAPEPIATDSREAAIEAVLRVAGSRDDFGADPARLDEDRAAILPLLDHAFGLGVPPSNKMIRDALLDRWLALLDGEGNYTVFRREVELEIERRSQAATDSDEEEAEDDAGDAGSDTDILAHALLPVLKGKRLLMLGGVPRVQTAPKLQDVLGLEEVLWPEAKKADTPDKFETVMRKADIIVIVKNFSRHAASHAAAEIAKETGGHCVMLPAGYGVARIIAQLHAYFKARGMVTA